MKPIINQSETPIGVNELKSKKYKVEGVVDLILIATKQNEVTKT